MANNFCQNCCHWNSSYNNAGETIGICNNVSLKLKLFVVVDTKFLNALEADAEVFTEEFMSCNNWSKGNAVIELSQSIKL